MLASLRQDGELDSYLEYCFRVARKSNDCWSARLFLLKVKITHKAVKNAHNNRNEQLAVIIGRIAPVIPERPLCELLNLYPDRRREFGLVVLLLVCSRGFAALKLEAFDDFLNLLCFLAIPPLLVPVDTSSIGTLGFLCGSLQNKLGNVLLFWAMDASVSEIFNDIAAIVSDRSKIESYKSSATNDTSLGTISCTVPSGIECEHRIELLNELRRWLMDCADNGLAGARELFQKSNDGPGTLTVQTRCRLV